MHWGPGSRDGRARALAPVAWRVARRAAVVVAITVAGLATWLAAGGAHPAGARGAPPLAPLDTMTVPAPPNATEFIRDGGAAVKLGKALFWDMQAGSDGRTACASCHFAAGADNRSRNQINPRGAGGFTMHGPNAQLSAADFPFHKLTNPDDRASAVVSDTDNVAGSQGVLPSLFTGITLGEPVDDQTFAASDSDFQVGGVPVRRSTGRNTPSVINAVFNFRNFWDGRAQNDFNGVNPFGSRDTAARVGKVGASGAVDQVPVSLSNSSLASQAVGPPGNPVEMSSDGRTLSDIGRKLLSLRPLRTQIVSPRDSVLGADVADSGRGLQQSYGDLVRAAFQPAWWDSTTSLDAPNGRAYPLMAFNFPLFWGLAIQAYEATLVSDQTPVDRFMKGDAGALSPAAARGMSVFQNEGECMECHNGPAMTSATAFNVAVEGATEADKAGRVGDTGFVNIGVRPTATDPGIGGLDPFGKPLSITRLGGQTPDAVDGAFKVPGLRNVALTAPYFHNGGEMTLRQVVDFYSRGGSFTNAELSPDLQPLHLSNAQKDDLVAFLEALTDPRVRDQSAPFDHPELFVPSGAQTGADGAVTTDAAGRALDCFRQIAATGAGGGAPLTAFPAFTGPPCDEPVDLQNPPPVPRPPAVPGGDTSGGGDGGAGVDTPGPAAEPAAIPAAVAAPALPGAGAGGDARRPALVPAVRVRCVVPSLRGRSLGQARLLLTRAHCRLGQVARARPGRRRLVIGVQWPGAGARGRAGMHVMVRLLARR
jgi:cytochrome c peroxidase